MSVPVTGINMITIQLGFVRLPNVGDSISAYSSVIPGNATNKAINWSSSDTRYLSVVNNPNIFPNGQVTAVANGVADIIATTVDGGFIARYTNFYVGATAPIFVTGINAITAPGDATTVAEGETLALSSSVTPANAFNTKITWASSNPSVATVNATTGVVTGVASGSTVITATTANGGFVDTYNITVPSSGVVTGVSINAPVMAFTPGQSAVFTARITPTDATDPSVTWSSSNPSVATVDELTGLVTGVMDGSATITATSVSSPGVSGSIGIIVSSTPVPCFPEGTRIATADGYKAVEDVCETDMLLTADGRTVSVTPYKTIVAHSTKESAPYTIPADTIMKGMPAAELRLSPWHAFMVGPNAWQKPAIASLCYKGIKQDAEGQQVTYYHFEAPNYLRDNFVVAGAIVESFANNQLKGVNPYTYHKDKMYFTRASAVDKTSRSATL